MTPKLVIRTILRAMAALNEKTIKDALLYFRTALCTTNNPTRDATKLIVLNIKAFFMSSMPISAYCNVDIVDENKTMKELVAAVIY